jgi:phosphoribosyl 1,2-cyclic phosphodiesterase
VAHDGLKQVYLAHLSSECNTPEVALNTVSSILERNGFCLPIAVAHQEKKTTATLFN